MKGLLIYSVAENHGIENLDRRDQLSYQTINLVFANLV